MKLAKLLLLPFSWLYGIVTWVRNKFFDAGIMPSTKFDIPIITVGNLTMGGTGKTPHIDYLTNLLGTDYKLGVVSRGYGRKTKGFFQVETSSKAREVGDEPLQLKLRHPKVSVAVGEQRALAIPELLGNVPDTEVILLDDAFQHRAVNAGLNVLLTDYSNLFFYDYVVPAGSLREFRKGYLRADIIVVTKCPSDLSEGRKEKIIQKIKPSTHQKVAFSFVDYGKIISITDNTELSQSNTTEIDSLLVTGIAKPTPLVDKAAQTFKSVKHLKYADHHNFTDRDIERIIEEYNNLSSANKVILTTEKDAMRLKETKLAELPIYYWQIAISFMGNDKQVFDESIVKYIRKEKNNSNE